MLLDASPPTVRLGGSALAGVSASGRLIRTRVIRSCLNQSFTSIVVSPDQPAIMASNGGSLIYIRSGNSTPKYSTNGTSFAACGTPTNAISAIVGSNGTYVGACSIAATGTGNIQRSTDHGVTWTQPTLPSAATWGALATDGKGTWVCVNGATSATSCIVSTDDGVTWVAGASLPVSTTYNSVAHLNGVWCAGAYYGSVCRTTNPLTTAWVGVSSNEVVAAGDFFFSFASDGTSATYGKSNDGLVWTGCTTNTGPTAWPIFPAWFVYADGIYYAMTAGSYYIGFSKDLITWRSLGQPGQNSGRPCAVFNGKPYFPLNNLLSVGVWDGAPYYEPVEWVTE